MTLPTVVFITALSREFKAVADYLTSPLQEEQHPQGKIYYWDEYPAENPRWQVVVVEAGQTNHAVAIETGQAITHFKPDYAFLVGVAGGIKEDVALGDVVVAETVKDYEGGKVTDDGFLPRGEVGKSSCQLVERAKAMAHSSDWHSKIKRETATTTAPKALVATITSGAKVVGSITSETCKFIKKNYSEAVAVEMEGIGFLEAVRRNEKVHGIVIRGISDLLDKNAAHDDHWQPIAAQNAAAFAFAMLDKLLPVATLIKPSVNSAQLQQDAQDTVAVNTGAGNININVTIGFSEQKVTELFGEFAKQLGISATQPALDNFFNTPQHVPEQVAQDAVAVINTGAGNLTTGLSEQKVTELFGEFAKQLGIPATQPALDKFFNTLQRAPVSLADLDKTLREIAERHRELLIRAAASTSEDSEVQNLLQQATQALKQFDFETADNLLNQAQQRDATAIEVLEQEAQRIAEVTSQRKVSRATTLFTLAESKDTQLAYRDAARYYQEAAELLPAGHEIKKAACLNNAGLALYSAGEYEQALPLYQETLKIGEQVLGKQHPHYATYLNNLALLYKSQGKYDKALALYQAPLEIVEQVLGKQHPDYAGSLNNLAALYYSQGQYDQALPLYQEALKVVEQVLGKQHPDYAKSLNNLAGLYQAQGKYNQALPLHQEALTIREQVLGKQHPDYASSLNNLAALYYSQERYEQALPLFQEALDICINVLGKQHPHTQMVMESYSRCLAAVQGVENQQEARKDSPHRNAPCPCGSGQRYKHCCGQAV